MNIVKFEIKTDDDLQAYKLLMRIKIIRRHISSNIWLQQSNIIKCNISKVSQKIFYPKIFLSRYEYYMHIYKQFKKIYNYIRMNKNKKIKLIVITHYKEILYC
jgi:hypothetical protein